MAFVVYGGGIFVALPKDADVVSRTWMIMSPEQTAPSLLAVLGKQLRVYHWVKNLLLVVPIALAHQLQDTQALISVLFGFLAFSCTASTVYIINDIADVEHDRLHPRKRHRPLAAGHISVPAAIALAALLLTGAIMITVLVLPPAFAGWLAFYAVVTTAYSFVLKRMVLVDVIALAGLYSLRIAAGGAAADVPVSTWLLGFSLFLFMSLAFLKRYTELLDTIEREGRTVSGRGYHVGDADFVLVAGAALGYVAILVFTRYLDAEQVRNLYTHPEYLWLIAPCLVYWVSHLWLRAHRGEMHDDPIVFAARDAASWVVGAAVVAITIAASM
jgi:4-hydroxybenzoate polyprenyltransferase